MKVLKNAHLSVMDCRAQTFDGTGNISRKSKG